MSAGPPRAEPAYFGSAQAPLFGWLHRSATAEAALGLVVCNPFGFEEVCAHRALRDLARAVAAAGLPTLRFDYAACGNSDGETEAEDQLSRWRASLHQAIDALKQASGVPRVVLLGVRLGAALATLAAMERDDVAGLIVIAPVLRGRTYLRELTVLRRTGREGGAEAGDPPGLESAGFVLTPASCSALQALDLRTLARAPAPRVLIVERDDLPESNDWAGVVQRTHAEVELVQWPGYAAMVDDPQRARTPQRIVEGVVEALARWQTGLTQVPVRPSGSWGRPLLQAPRASPEPLHIDVGGSALFALMHRPLVPAAGDPAVLMLNSGSVHSIGPNRLWVHLARRWAAAGVRVMRLDIAGIGDSNPRAGEPDNVVYSSHALADVAAALTWLREREGARSCHVMGLCSGAYHAFKAATGGLPVASALMINPLTYFWGPGATLSDIKDYEVVELADKYRDMLFTLQPWQRLWRGELHLSLIATVAWRWLLRWARRALREVGHALRLPLKDDLAHELRMAARARVPLHFVFAAQATGYTLLREQSGGALARMLAQGAVSVDFVPGADHTFTRAQARERLVGVVDGLMRAACGAAPRG
jgi:alpha-beta hydrolase superfamily lysophospholipase